MFSVVDHFAGDGPVPTGTAPRFVSDPRTRVHLTDGRRWLAERPAASLDLVTMEPLLPYAPGTTALYSAEFYAAAREALAPGGMVVQWLPTHALQRRDFEVLLATFARSFDDGAEFTSIQVNDNFACAVHKDKYNRQDSVSLMCALGDHDGGDVWVRESDSIVSGIT